MMEGAGDGLGIGADDGMDDYRGFTVSQDEMGALQYQRSETMQRKNKLIFSGVVAASLLGEKKTKPCSRLRLFVYLLFSAKEFYCVIYLCVVLCISFSVDLAAGGDGT